MIQQKTNEVILIELNVTDNQLLFVIKRNYLKKELCNSLLRNTRVTPWSITVSSIHSGKKVCSLSACD